MTRGPDLEYVENLKVNRARLDVGDDRWFVSSANDWVVAGPFDEYDDAVAKRKDLRDGAYQEAAEEGDDE